MVKLSLVLAFVLGGLFSPGGQLLGLFMTQGLYKAMSLFEKNALVVLFHYMIPAILIYIVLRFLKIDARLKFNKAISIMFGTAIGLYIFYLSARMFADSIPGGGFGFAVRRLSPLVIEPAWVLMIIGLIWLLYKSFQESINVEEWAPFSKTEKRTLLILSSLPVILLATMFIRPEGPLRLIYVAEQTFDEQCKQAGETIIEHPEGFSGIFLESTGHRDYGGINSDNEYYSSGGGVSSTFHYQDAGFRYMETINYDKDKSEYKYIRYENGNKIKTNDLSSPIRVYWEGAADDNSRKNGVYGTTIKVIEHQNNKLIATTTFFTSSRLRKICGHIVDNKFVTTDFLNRVFLPKKE